MLNQLRHTGAPVFERERERERERDRERQRERERKRESTQAGGGAEREGDTESEAGFRLCSVEPNAGLEPTNCEIMSLAKWKLDA